MLPILLAASLPRPLLTLKGTFVEACSCVGTCGYETAGRATGCAAMGAYRIDRGAYGAADLGKTRLAFVVTKTGDVFPYIDAPTASKRAGAAALAKAMWKDFGTWHEPKQAQIDIKGSAGAYTMTIDRGRIANLAITPVKGGDRRSFVRLDNVMGDPYDSLWQATVKDALFKGEGQDFTLKGTSAFFVDHLAVKKRM